MDPSSALPENPASCLPQELIYSLIDLVRDDHEMLKSLGLVSTAWYPQTRVYLFHGVSLGDTSFAIHNQARCYRLRCVLEQKPELRRLTSRLTIGDENHTGWIYSYPELAKVLPLFCSLEQIILRDMDWARCLPSVQIECYNAIARPTVSKLVLISIPNIDLTPPVQYHHIEDLIMQDVRPSPATSVTRGACLPLNNRALLGLPSITPDILTRPSTPTHLRTTRRSPEDAYRRRMGQRGDGSFPASVGDLSGDCSIGRAQRMRRGLSARSMRANPHRLHEVPFGLYGEGGLWI